MSSRSRALPLAIGFLVALATAVGLGFTARHPTERHAVEALEALAQTQTPAVRAVQATPYDLAAAKTFCAGSLVRHLSRLEREAPEQARRHGLTAQLRFGPTQAWNGLAAADVTLMLEGAQADLGQALAESSLWLPSTFFDDVRVTPLGDGARARLEAQGRVVCRAP